MLRQLWLPTPPWLAPMRPLLNPAQPRPCSFKGKAMLLLKAMHPLVLSHHRGGVVVAPKAQDLSAQHWTPQGRPQRPRLGGGGAGDGDSQVSGQDDDDERALQVDAEEDYVYLDTPW